MDMHRLTISAQIHKKLVTSLASGEGKVMMGQETDRGRHFTVFLVRPYLPVLNPVY